MKIKVITVDFWNTLFDSSNGIKRNAARQHTFIGEIAKFKDVHISSEQFQEAVSSSWDFFKKIWENEQRTPDTVETITYLWSYLKLPHNQDSINIVARSFAESILDYPPLPMENVTETLSDLKEKGYKIGLISDTGFTPGIILKEVMHQAGVLDYFDYFSFSDETGVSKPDPLAFTTILDKTNAKPIEALHIGDIERTDIQGAKRLGMKAIKFSPEKTEEQCKFSLNSTVAEYEINNWKFFEQYLSKVEKNLSQGN